MSYRPIRFFHRGEIVAVHQPVATRTVLSWLREDQRLTGTKEGCNEGDCGACTVLLGELDAQGDLKLQPVNACIQFLPSLDGKALFTVEDLQGRHPAQKAMVECHASQCGFCTPGFVMTLAALHQKQASCAEPAPVPTRAELADALSGNLCRCTGYRPILDAGQKMFEQAAPALDTTAARQALLQLQSDSSLHDEAFHAPRSLDELATLRAALPGARLLAGGTDVALWVNKQMRNLGTLIYLGRVPELHTIDASNGQLRIGAGATLTRAWDSLAQHWPELREMGLRFASPPVRNAGTLGGNVANGSPIGDGAPVLMALGAQLRLRCGPAQRLVPLDAFYTGYMSNQLQPGEFIQSIELPLPEPGTQLRAYKLSKRFDCDISGLAAGMWLRLDAHGVVADVRLAFGGLAATVKRAAEVERYLRGQPWTEATVAAAMLRLNAEFTPLSDLRASANYRQRAAGNLLKRFWLETRPQAPLSAQEVSVWSAGVAP